MISVARKLPSTLTLGILGTPSPLSVIGLVYGGASSSSYLDASYIGGSPNGGEGSLPESGPLAMGVRTVGSLPLLWPEDVWGVASAAESLSVVTTDSADVARL